jgi:hypothetical protein
MRDTASVAGARNTQSRFAREQLVQGWSLSHRSFRLRHSKHEVIMRFRRRIFDGGFPLPAGLLTFRPTAAAAARLFPLRSCCAGADPLAAPPPSATCTSCARPQSGKRGPSVLGSATVGGSGYAGNPAEVVRPASFPGVRPSTPGGGGGNGFMWDSEQVGGQ